MEETDTPPDGTGLSLEALMERGGEESVESRWDEKPGWHCTKQSMRVGKVAAEEGDRGVEAVEGGCLWREASKKMGAAARESLKGALADVASERRREKRRRSIRRSGHERREGEKERRKKRKPTEGWDACMRSQGCDTEGERRTEEKRRKDEKRRPRKEKKEPPHFFESRIFESIGLTASRSDNIP
jgi:hypothetical protein